MKLQMQYYHNKNNLKKIINIVHKEIRKKLNFFLKKIKIKKLLFWIFLY